MSTDPRIEAAARAVHPHLWDGKTEQALLRLTGAAACTPSQAKESVVRLQSHRLEEVQAYLEAADQAIIITTGEGLDALPVGSRVVMGDYYILREETPVDDGVWLDLGNGLRLDAEDLRIILKSYPARVIQWGQT